MLKLCELAQDVAELPQDPVIHELQMEELPEPEPERFCMDAVYAFQHRPRQGIRLTGWRASSAEELIHSIQKDHPTELLDHTDPELECVVCLLNVDPGAEFFRCGTCQQGYCTICHKKWSAACRNNRRPILCAHCVTEHMYTMKRYQNGPDPTDLHPIVNWAMNKRSDNE